ncbi:phospholipid-transporting ATPase IF-like isoform X2 [Gigantopelta aegis]|nr:phospholipid-transporting ATPase IF-like isoform X2 [Gigantopelta aegis]
MKEKTTQTRRIYIGNLPPPDVHVYIPKHYNTNQVVSSKYTVFTFIPKNLFEQFRRIANFYFLCIGLIQLTIDTPVTPATSILPLCFVIFTSAVKQGYEDWLRHRMDREVNYSPAMVIRDGAMHRIHSMEIKVGDIVKVFKNEDFPCDLVMLSSSENNGTCTITTANLDGETNLKTVFSTPDTQAFRYADEFDSLEAVIECHQPIADLYKFVGNITVMKDGSNVLRPLGPENLLLRGARLKNTKYIYGCAIYTGQETKMAINSKFTKIKFSRVERAMNSFLVVFLILMFLLSSIATFFKYRSRDSMYKKRFIHHEDYSGIGDVTNIFEEFLMFMVLLNYIIPISLYVTVEIQKFVGSLFFKWDSQLCDKSLHLQAKANTSDLNEELGQVEYLFSDKTGTLTMNMMEFRQCSINGIKYEEVDQHLCLCDGPTGDSERVKRFTPLMEDFFTVLTLCHTVRLDYGVTDDLPSKKGKKMRKSTTSLPKVSSSRGRLNDTFEYQASSPDEKALIEACKRYGFVYLGTNNEYMEVKFPNETEKRRFRLLHLLEFDPTRKRMSLIVQNSKDEIYLLCKGAEAAVLDRVTSGLKDITLKHVDEYAVLGLRTLVIAHRKLSVEEYEEIDKKIMEAKTSLDYRKEKMEAVFDFVEKDFFLLGATAVEDKLQEYVPQTFRSLRRAGIKVWVLTGDKAETAVNISHSAGHFQAHMLELWLINTTTSTTCAEMLTQHYRRIESNKKEEYVFVIDGHSLVFAMQDHKNLFLSLCLCCDSVLCCRMSPVQKAEVVHMVKNSKEKPVTAAIGDGANDVSMIQEAHVGLGIMGKEGRQASTCSDYSFAKFHFILRVLLVHGHFYYIRIANLVQYFFYKNIVFMFPQFYFIFYSSYSSQALYDGLFLVFFNLTFSSLPILIYGIFEQHISQTVLLQYPELYRKISRNKLLDWKHFLLWTSTGVWHSLVAYLGVFHFIGNTVFLHPDGKMVGMWTLGSMVFTIVVVVVNLKLALRTYHWCGLTLLSYICTFAAFIVTTFIFSDIKWPKILMESQALYGVITNLCISANIWLAIVILSIICLLPDFVFRAFSDIYFVKQETKRRIQADDAACLSKLGPTDNSYLYYDMSQTELSKNAYTNRYPETAETRLNTAAKEEPIFELDITDPVPLEMTNPVEESSEETTRQS